MSARSPNVGLLVCREVRLWGLRMAIGSAFQSTVQAARDGEGKGGDVSLTKEGAQFGDRSSST